MSKYPQLKQSNKGFTLLEMLVAISLSFVMLGALYGVYVVSYRAYSRNVIIAELNQNARIALERITRDLRQTERITTALPPDETDETNPPPSEIMFADGHDNDKIRYIIYKLESGNLYRKRVHYSFSIDPNNPDWVTWNALDANQQLPTQHVDENTIKADKITNLKFYGEKLVTIELVASSAGNSVYYKTETLGRNIK